MRLTGRIPLVNTSSEEEDEDGDLEDSFDRQIAASLEAARPRQLDSPQFLVRGSSARSTMRKSASNNRLTSSSSTASFGRPGGPGSPRRQRTLSASNSDLPRAVSDGKLLEVRETFAFSFQYNNDVSLRLLLF